MYAGMLICACSHCMMYTSCNNSLHRQIFYSRSRCSSSASASACFPASFSASSLYLHQLFPNSYFGVCVGSWLVSLLLSTVTLSTLTARSSTILSSLSLITFRFSIHFITFYLWGSVSISNMTFSATHVRVHPFCLTPHAKADTHRCGMGSLWIRIDNYYTWLRICDYFLYK